MDFGAVLSAKVGGITRPLPLTNSFGRVIPALDDQLTAELLGIGPNETVLDIGGGSSPFRRANTVTDAYLTHNSHRGGQPVPAGHHYVECRAEELPFRDGEFDFAISRQVFEHTDDPAAACREMMRVARRGFIETPERNYDILLGPNPSHQWFISTHGTTLVFERRRFIRHPFRHIGLSFIPSSPEGQYLIHWEFKNLSNVQYYWAGSFDYIIIDDGNGFDYHNPDHAAEAHLDSALCSLLFAGSPPAHREADAREALRLRPDWALAHNTLAALLWLQGRREEAEAHFTRAALLDPTCPTYIRNASLPPEGTPEIVDFTDTLPLDEAFMREMSTPGGIDMPRLLRGRNPK